MSFLDSIFDRLEPNPNKSQILLEIRSPNETVEKALYILRSLEEGPINYSYISEKSPIIVKIDIKSEVREAVSKLVEAGFLKIKGISKKDNILRKKFD